MNDRKQQETKMSTKTKAYLLFFAPLIVAALFIVVGVLAGPHLNAL